MVTWDVHDNQRRDWWGTPVVQSWYTDASLVLDLDGNVKEVVARTDDSEMAVTIGAEASPTPAPRRARIPCRSTRRASTSWATSSDACAGLGRPLPHQDDGGHLTGVPAVVVPLFSLDQWENGAAVARAGAGVALDLDRSERHERPTGRTTEPAPNACTSAAPVTTAPGV